MLHFLRQTIKSILYPWYEKRLVRKLDFSQTPHHVGVILDGNRRWAKANPDEIGGTHSSRGHRAGAEKIREFLTWCEAAKINVVTLWLLSNDNFKRTPEELNVLLAIIGETVRDLGDTKRWPIHPLGSLELLPEQLRKNLLAVAEATANIKGLQVNVAIGYGGRLEIVDAVKKYLTTAQSKSKDLATVIEELSAEEIEKNLYTAGQPDPELVIRTSGEQRLGGFLLWQSAHSEFYFCEAYWPDFRHVDFLRALRSYAQRHRRFGV
jgi:short-chain Z-isoprenyl diphosphate synthase